MEPVAVAGLVSTIIQFIDFGNKVVDRLNDFKHSINEVPRTFRKFNDQLPLLIDTLRRTKIQADSGHVAEATAKALNPVVEGCLAQAKRLEYILVKSIPLENDSTWCRRVKALSSLAHDKTVQQIASELESHVKVLTYHQATSISDLSGQLVIRGASQLFQLNTEPEWEPYFMVKFEKDDNFTGREDIIEEIDTRLIGRQHRVALTGIGGVGKSQTAIEYCYRYRRDHPKANIFWVHASNHTRFAEAYYEIARELALPGIDNPDIDTLRLVSKWLNNDANGPWLFVLDNADSIETFFGLSSHSSLGENGQPLTALVSYLPQSSKGAMIITTRDRRIGDRLVTRGKPIDVLPFEGEDAKRLLQKTLSDVELNDEESMALLKALDFLPLAITQAAAFIRENGICLIDYLELLNKEAKDLLTKNHYDPGRDLENWNSVFQTWKLSFESIRKQNPRAAEILSLMAVLDRLAIQEQLVCKDDELKTDFTAAIGILKAFSLVTKEKGAATFGMHRLVQLSMQKWLELEDVIEEWQEKALTAVSKCCPFDGRYENWTAWETINPHVYVALGFICNTDSCLLMRASILSNAANYDTEQGRYKAAYKKAIEAYAIRDKVLGPEHPATLTSISSQASVLFYQGKYEAAEEISRRALNGCEKVLGYEHPDTLASVNNLALALMRQGRYKAAEEACRRALAGREKVLGLEHPDTLISASHLASAVGRQGKYEAAEEINQRALKGREKVLGPKNPDTLESVSKLAWALARQGKYEAAREMNEQVLEQMEKTLGFEHPITLVSASNLASVLEMQGSYKAAEDMTQRVLDERGKVLGSEHPDTLMTMSNLASVLERQGKYKASEDMYRQVLDGTERVLGPEHPDTLMNVNELAWALLRQGKYKEAEEMSQRALNKSENVLGPEHWSTLTTVNDLGFVLMKQGNYKAAEEMIRRALIGREKILGSEDPTTLSSITYLVSLLMKQGKYKEAEEMNQQVLYRSEKALGVEHPLTLASVDDRAWVLIRQGKYIAAEGMGRRALDGREKALGPEHPMTLSSVYCLGYLLRNQMRYDEASILYKRAYLGYQKALGLDHPSTLECSKQYLSLLEELKRD